MLPKISTWCIFNEKSYDFGIYCYFHSLHFIIVFFSFQNEIFFLLNEKSKFLNKSIIHHSKFAIAKRRQSTVKLFMVIASCHLTYAFRIDSNEQAPWSMIFGEFIVTLIVDMMIVHEWVMRCSNEHDYTWNMVTFHAHYIIAYCIKLLHSHEKNNS